MNENYDVLHVMAKRALSGSDSHVGAANAVDGLEWRVAAARPEGAPHSILQLVNHMTYWQEWALKWLDGKPARAPKHAAGSWPGKASPASRKEWTEAVRRYRRALDALGRRSQRKDLLSKRGKMTRLEMLHIIGAHTSYHVGEVVLMRQMQGAWPPPSGGVTW